MNGWQRALSVTSGDFVRIDRSLDLRRTQCSPMQDYVLTAVPSNDWPIIKRYKMVITQQKVDSTSQGTEEGKTSRTSPALEQPRACPSRKNRTTPVWTRGCPLFPFRRQCRPPKKSSATRSKLNSIIDLDRCIFYIQ
ncbi:hypothetical protein KIN20_038368 [Parelaphostrongylus tenuis]|uniref:Uncharacterized protein n=1 Tax=Parelaphostrongylus tenuis TaxID=148309 RepID=A0AAD5WMW7_PARTN|nr:hypothetical protein KIN20_038368 [Parelaphostrongylus tenuis]